MLVGIFSGCGAKEETPPSMGDIVDGGWEEDDGSDDAPIIETQQSAPITGAEASAFSIYRESDGLRISLGDKRENIEKILGPDQRFVVEFEEDNIERVDYWDTENVYMDYDVDGIVRAMRFGANGWKIYNGIGLGNPIEGAKANYPAEHVFKFDETDDIWIAYDENGQSVPFSMNAKYIVRLDVIDAKVAMVTIQDNTIREGIF